VRIAKSALISRSLNTSQLAFDLNCGKPDTTSFSPFIPSSAIVCYDIESIVSTTALISPLVSFIALLASRLYVLSAPFPNPLSLTPLRRSSDLRLVLQSLRPSRPAPTPHLHCLDKHLCFSPKDHPRSPRHLTSRFFLHTVPMRSCACHLPHCWVWAARFSSFPHLQRRILRTSPREHRT